MNRRLRSNFREAAMYTLNVDPLGLVRSVDPERETASAGLRGRLTDPRQDEWTRP